MWQKHRTYYYQIIIYEIRGVATEYNALVTGWKYRLYYVPRSKTMSALEPLSSRDLRQSINRQAIGQ